MLTIWDRNNSFKVQITITYDLETYSISDPGADEATDPGAEVMY